MLYIDDKLPTHPKIFKAGAHLGTNGPARALALFLAGLAYARDHLSDGFVPDKFVAGCALVDRPLDVARVLTDRRIRLWRRVRGGYQIHDYHDWNPTASEIKERRAKEREKKRRQRGLSPGESLGDKAGDTDGVPAGVPEPASRARAGTGVDPGTGDLGKGGVGEKGFNEPDAALVQRAERFVVRYGELFERFRKGRYAPGDKDLPAAIALVQTWDDARLVELVEAFLTTDDEFCRNGSGSIPQFRVRASWCDSRLVRHGL